MMAHDVEYTEDQAKKEAAIINRTLKLVSAGEIIHEPMITSEPVLLEPETYNHCNWFQDPEELTLREPEFTGNFVCLTPGAEQQVDDDKLARFLWYYYQ